MKYTVFLTSRIRLYRNKHYPIGAYKRGFFNKKSNLIPFFGTLVIERTSL
jgi:hypothetical protein